METGFRRLLCAALIMLMLPALAPANDIDDALVVFAEAGDLDKVRHLVLSKGAKPNARDMFGRVALMEAAGGGHLPVVKFLIEQGANVNIRGSMGYTPLMKAIDAGHVEVVKYLGTKGADLGLRDSYGNLPLDLAEKGPSRAVYNHLRPIYARFELTEELLQSAGKGHLGDVKQIIAAGLSVNAKSGDGITALMAAAGYGKPNVVKWLIENEANPNIVADNGMTALYGAVKYRYGKIVEYLLDHGAEIQPSGQSHSVINLARSTGDHAIINLIANHKERTDEEQRLSHEYGNAQETLGKLRSIKPGMLTAGETEQAIDSVAKMLSIKSEWIRKLGDDSFDSINLRLNLIGRSWFPTSTEDTERIGMDYSPLMMAAQLGRPYQISSIIDQGAEVNERNGIGETALMALAKIDSDGLPKERIREYSDSIEALLKAGAEINAMDVAGWTPLMWAAFNGSKPLVKLLVEKGADPKITAKSGAAALSIAESLGYENTAAIIKASNRQTK